MKKETPDALPSGNVKPQSIESEQAIIGSILIYPEKINVPSVMQLKPEHFFFKKNEQIFDCIIDLYNTSTEITGTAVLEKLREKGYYEGEEDKKYLIGLCESASVLNNIDYYAKKVLDKAISRNILDLCEKAAEKCYEGEEPSKLIEMVESGMFNISNAKQSKDMVMIETVAKAELDRWSEMKADITGKYDTVKLEISSVDNFMGGFNNSDLVVIAGRPGMGKTSFALNIAYNVAASGRYNPKKSVAFFSLEMSKEQIADRVISMARLIDSKDLRLGTMTDEQFGDIFSFWQNDLQGFPLYIDDSSAITVNEMKSKLRKIPNLGLIVIDYLQLMTSGKRIENRVQEISEITRSLKIMAKEFNVPILLLSQLSRNIEQRAEGNKPKLSDLRDSGSIEQDADMVIFLSRPAYYDKDTKDKNLCEIIIQKNRHGAVGTVETYWDGSHTSFKSMVKE